MSYFRLCPHFGRVGSSKTGRNISSTVFVSRCESGVGESTGMYTPVPIFTLSRTGDLTATTIVKAAIPHGFGLPEAGFVLFGAHDLFLSCVTDV